MCGLTWGGNLGKPSFAFLFAYFFGYLLRFLVHFLSEPSSVPGKKYFFFTFLDVPIAHRRAELFFQNHHPSQLVDQSARSLTLAHPDLDIVIDFAD